MILVTGATGTTGSEVVKQLAAAGVQVRALVRNPQKAAGLQGSNVELVKGDLGEPGTLDAAFKGVTKLFLLTNGDPRQTELQHNAIEAAKRNGVQHVVKISALGADANSPVSLARWHAQTEQELKSSGLKWTILQPHYFMQNLMMSADTIKSQGAFYGAMKNGKVAMVDARDIAAVAVKVLTTPGHEGKTYVITGPEGLSMDEVAQKLSAVLGKPVKYVDISGEQFKQALTGAGVPEWMASDLMNMNLFFGSGAAGTPDPSAQQITGASGRTFDAFARDFSGAFRS
ncbi:MAG TPA: SDR family oxidoreductase [Myxococcaceae bacterium]|nr:SDR family oxidoreductase [Myxococcaceae bacterium]